MNSNFAQLTILGFLETLVNNALKLDPGTLNQLAGLQGKLIHIRCTTPLTDIYIIPGAQGVILQGHQENKPDCSIIGTPFALLQLATADNKAKVLLNEDVRIKGDAELSQKLQAIVSNLDIDWEAKMAEFIGDIAAHEIGNQLRGLLKWGQRTFDSLTMDVDEYLHEEARSLPPRAELDSFYQAVEQLVLDTDRLEARINRIKHQPAAAKSEQTSPKMTQKTSNGKTDKAHDV